MAAIFLGAWILSYLFLPEGILCGRTLTQVAGGSGLAGGSVWLEWLRILALNLVAMSLLIIAPNILRTEGDYPLRRSHLSGPNKQPKNALWVSCWPWPFCCWPADGKRTGFRWP